MTRRRACPSPARRPASGGRHGQGRRRQERRRGGARPRRGQSGAARARGRGGRGPARGAPRGGARRRAAAARAAARGGDDRARGGARRLRAERAQAARARPPTAREHELPGAGRRRPRPARVPRAAPAFHVARRAPARPLRLRPRRRRCPSHGALAHVGPVAERLSSIGRRLADPTATLVCLVTTPEELAVRETVDLHRELAGRLGLPVAPPIVNALPPRRFTAADVAALARLETNAPAHPYLAAARLELARRREAAAQVAVLRRSLGTPVRLPFLYGGPESDGGLARLSAELALAAGLAA